MDTRFAKLSSLDLTRTMQHIRMAFEGLLGEDGTKIFGKPIFPNFFQRV
jgi:hypothetical protein